MYLIKGYKKQWYIRYLKPDGKWTMVCTKKFNKKEAKEYLEYFKKKFGSIENKRSNFQYVNLNLEQLRNKIFDLFKNENKDIEIIDYTFKKLILYFGNNKIVDNILPYDAEQYKLLSLKRKLVRNANKSISSTTFNIELRTLKSIFNKAVKWELILKNPFQKIDFVKVPEKEKKTLTDDEIQRLLKIIDNELIKDVFLFALYTGCRRGEIANLQFSDLDFFNRIIKIRNKEGWTTKTKYNREIPMSDNIYELLFNRFQIKINNDLSKLNYYIFGKDNGIKYEDDYFTKKFKKYLRKLKISEDIHFHSLRHTSLTNMIKNDVNINFVKEIAGHKKITTTMQYTHIYVNDLRKAVNSVNYKFF
jgi:integrase